MKRLTEIGPLLPLLSSWMISEFCSTTLRGDLSRHLLQLDHDELRRFERCKANDDIYNAEINIVLRGRLFIALDEVSIARCATLKGALTKQSIHKGADV